MGIFNDLMGKIFKTSAATAPAVVTTNVAAPESKVAARAREAKESGTTATATAAAPQVDVAAILNGLAAKNREKLDWKHSIVDLMKLVGMDSSLAARKELAKDLKYTGDTTDTAKMNMWLHKEVMRKLAENGGKVPADLLNS